MKTLVNKNIPAIRITAPEVEKVYDKYYYIIGIRLGLLQENWTLVEEESVDLEKTVEFECIGKKVKMTVQELINYYIDSECADVADECGF